MKLKAIGRARSIWVVYLVDLNPRGRNLLPLISSVIEKYKFLQYPSKPEELDVSKGVKFVNGSFQKDSQNDIIIDLTIFGEFMVADTRSSTKDSDAFLDDFLTWLSSEFGFVSYQEVLRSRVYLSELWVQTNKSLSGLNPKLEAFSKRITSLIEGHSHHPVAFETAGIYFWTDPNIANSPGPFRLERASDVPFTENRYYSAAPLQTDIHIEMLSELENILSS